MVFADLVHVCPSDVIDIIDVIDVIDVECSCTHCDKLNKQQPDPRVVIGLDSM